MANIVHTDDVIFLPNGRLLDFLEEFPLRCIYIPIDKTKV